MGTARINASLRLAHLVRTGTTGIGHSALDLEPEAARGTCAYRAGMKKLLLLAILVSLGVVAARKLRVD